MSRHSLLLLLFAACGGNGGVAIGGDCSQEDICEDGAVCDFTDPGGPICIDGGGDLDGDGLANNKDFCNHQAGGQFDEDGDGIGDDCDGCPISPPAGDDDDDGDGVVEPCDPDPREPGDQIVAFSGFNDAVLPENWMATSGWTFVNGEAVATSQSPVNNEVLVAPLPLTSRTVAVFSEYRIESLDPQATQNRAGVVAVDQRPAGGTDATCAGNRTAGMDSLVLDTTLNASNRTFPEDTDLFNTDLFRLTLVINNANAGCALKSGPLTGAVTAQTNGELSNQGGLTAKGVTARYQYLLVVQRGPVSQN